MKNLFSLLVISMISMSLYATTHVVQVGNGGNSYNPSTLAINLGDTVNFQWVTGSHPTASDSSAWAVFQMNSSSTSFNLVLTSAGSYPYHCQFHGGSGGVGMSGTITVNDTASGGATSFKGTIVEVGQGGNFYTPDSVHIDAGDTVRFTWISGIHPTASDDGTWTTFPMNSVDTLYDLILNTNGTYQYFCTNHGASGRIGMSGVITVGTTTANISEVKNIKSLSISPNPFMDQVTLKHNYKNLTHVEIFNVVGKKVKSFSNNNMKVLDLSDLHKGIYFVKTYNGQQVLNTQKLIKK